MNIRRPLRSYRFLEGVGRSGLSRQALLIGTYLLLLVVHWALALATVSTLGLGVAAVAVGGLAVVAMGLTYWLASQPTWRHWSTLVSLVGGVLAVGVALALVVALGWQSEWEGGSAGLLTARVLVLVGCAALGLAILGRALRLGNGTARAQRNATSALPRHRSNQVGAAGLVVICAGSTAVSFAWPWAIILSFVASVVAQWLVVAALLRHRRPSDWRSEVDWSPASGLAGKGA